MTQTGSVYGQALYDLAKAENLSGQILRELEVLHRSFEAEPDFLRLLSAPGISKEERCQVLEASFRGRVHDYLLNFLKILTEKGYIRQFDHCCEAYREQYNRDNGILPVTAVTAVPLTAQQSEKLRKKLGSLTGKEIHLLNRVQPGVLGGIRLDYDGKRLDDTLAHRLADVRSLLKNTVL